MVTNPSRNLFRCFNNRKFKINFQETEIPRCSDCSFHHKRLCSCLICCSISCSSQWESEFYCCSCINQVDDPDFDEAHRSCVFDEILRHQRILSTARKLFEGKEGANGDLDDDDYDWSIRASMGFDRTLDDEMAPMHTKTVREVPQYEINPSKLDFEGKKHVCVFNESLLPICEKYVYITCPFHNPSFHHSLVQLVFALFIILCNLYACLVFICF